jgi:hypothetical protein
MLIVILNFTLKLEIIVRFERQNKDDNLITDIHLVICILLVQRKKIDLRIFQSKSLILEMKFIDLILNKVNILNQSKGNQRMKIQIELVI